MSVAFKRRCSSRLLDQLCRPNSQASRDAVRHAAVKEGNVRVVDTLSHHHCGIESAYSSNLVCRHSFASERAQASHLLSARLDRRRNNIVSLLSVSPHFYVTPLRPPSSLSSLIQCASKHTSHPKHSKVPSRIKPAKAKSVSPPPPPPQAPSAVNTAPAAPSAAVSSATTPRLSEARSSGGSSSSSTGGSTGGATAGGVTATTGGSGSSHSPSSTAVLAGVAVAAVAGGAAWWVSGKEEGEGEGDKVGEERETRGSHADAAASELVARRVVREKEGEREDSMQGTGEAEEKMEADSTSLGGESRPSHSDVTTLSGTQADGTQSGAEQSTLEREGSERKGSESESDRIKRTEDGERRVSEVTTTPTTHEVSEAAMREERSDNLAREGGNEDKKMSVGEQVPTAAPASSGRQGGAGNMRDTDMDMAVEGWRPLSARGGASVGDSGSGEIVSGSTSGLSESYVASLMLRTAEEARKQQATEDEGEWRRRDEELKSFYRDQLQHLERQLSEASDRLADVRLEAEGRVRVVREEGEREMEALEALHGVTARDKSEEWQARLAEARQLAVAQCEAQLGEAYAAHVAGTMELQTKVDSLAGAFHATSADEKRSSTAHLLAMASFLLEEAAGNGRPLKPVMLLLQTEREGEGEGGRLEGGGEAGEVEAAAGSAAVTGSGVVQGGAVLEAGIGPEARSTSSLSSSSSSLSLPTPSGVTTDGMQRVEVAEHRRVVEAVLRSLPSQAVEHGVATRAQLITRLADLAPTLRQLALLPEGESGSRAGMVTFAFMRLAASLKVPEDGLFPGGPEASIARAKQLFQNGLLYEAAEELSNGLKGTQAEQLAEEWASDVRLRAIVEQGLRALKADALVVARALA